MVGATYPASMFPPRHTVVDSILRVVGNDPEWRVVSTTSSLIRTIPRILQEVLPPCGVSPVAPESSWLTLDFWAEISASRLGVFWRANPVTDEATRNQILKALLDAGAHTGFEYKGSAAAWMEGATPAFSGRTVSDRWWPKNGDPDLRMAALEVARQLELWTERLPAVLKQIRVAQARGVISERDQQVLLPAQEPLDTARRPRSDAPRRVQSTPAQAPTNASTPPIPDDIRGFRAQPHYTSIFEVYPDETHIYGTEDLYGDWNAEVLLMAKDAGSSRNFLPPSTGGLGWAWVHNPARPTNRNLVPLAEQLPCGKLYASFLGPLLRNDGQESGDLVIDASIRQFIQRLFIWTVENMPRLKTVAVLGQEGWRELNDALGMPHEARAWKRRHLSGEPLRVELGGRGVYLVALNHPARISASVLMQQPGWKWILQRHAGG